MVKHRGAAAVAGCGGAQVIHQKHKKSLEEITNDLCPVLSVQQLYRISTMYWDDRYNTETVAHEVRTPLRFAPLGAEPGIAAARAVLVVPAAPSSSPWHSPLRDNCL